MSEEVKKDHGAIDSTSLLRTAMSSLSEASSMEEVVPLPVDKICPNKYQPRKHFDRNSLKSLADSIKSKGVTTPIIVTKNDDPSSPSPYMIVQGERRWRASQMAGLDRIPAIIRDVSERDKKTHALIENTQREDLNAIEKALAFGELKNDMNDLETMEKETGHDKRSIQRYLKISRAVNVTEEIRELLTSRAHEISLETAYTFASGIADLFAKLAKSNKREYERLVEGIKKKGLKAKLPYLRNYFIKLGWMENPATEKSCKGDGNGVLRETDTIIIFHLRLKKGQTLPDDERESIRLGLERLTEVMSTLPSVDIDGGL